MATESDHPVLQLACQGVCATARLVTVSNHSVLQTVSNNRLRNDCLATVSNQPVLQPLQTVPRARRRFRHLNRMKNAGIPASTTQGGKLPSGLRISAGVSFLSNRGTLALARSQYDTVTVANAPNGDTRIQKRVSCRDEPLRLPPREKAFAFHPFDRRCDSSDWATEDSCYVYLYSLVAVSNQPVLQPDPRSVIKCH